MNTAEEAEPLDDTSDEVMTDPVKIVCCELAAVPVIWAED
jgi:hypothetical protein